MQALNGCVAYLSECTRRLGRKLYLANSWSDGNELWLIEQLYCSVSASCRCASPRHQFLSRVRCVFQVAVFAFGFAEVVVGLEVNPELGFHLEKVTEA